MLTISEATAVNTLVRALTGHADADGQLPDRDAVQAAVDLLLRGANKALAAGLKPGDVHVTDPAVQVLHRRDPDSSCDVTVYIGGQPVTAARTVDVDPGAGMRRTDLDARIAEFAGDATAFGRAAHEALTSAIDSEYVDDDRPDDAHILDTVRHIIRRERPTATTMRLRTSGQNHGYGFLLTDVVDADGTSLFDTDQATLARLFGKVADLLANIDWDGVVGENKHGDAEVAVNPQT